MLLVAATVQIRFGKASTRCSEERKISAKRLQSRNQGHARSQRTHRQLPMDADKRARLRCTTHAGDQHRWSSVPSNDALHRYRLSLPLHHWNQT